MGFVEQGIQVEYSFVKNKRLDLLEKIKNDFTATFHIAPVRITDNVVDTPFARRANVWILKAMVKVVGAKAGRKRGQKGI